MTVFFIQKRRFAFDIHLSLSNWSFLWKMTLFRSIFLSKNKKKHEIRSFFLILRAKRFFQKTLKISAPNSFFQNEPIFFYLILDFSASFECLKIRRLGERSCEDWKKSAEWKFSLSRNDDWLLTYICPCQIGHLFEKMTLCSTCFKYGGRNNECLGLDRGA